VGCQDCDTVDARNSSSLVFYSQERELASMVKQMQGYGWFPETFSNVWVDSYICVKKHVKLLLKTQGTFLNRHMKILNIGFDKNIHANTNSLMLF
jgi:hypothetical protein